MRSHGADICLSHIDISFWCWLLRSYAPLLLLLLWCAFCVYLSHCVYFFLLFIFYLIALYYFCFEHVVSKSTKRVCTARVQCVCDLIWTEFKIKRIKQHTNSDERRKKLNVRCRWFEEAIFIKIQIHLHAASQKLPKIIEIGTYIICVHKKVYPKFCRNGVASWWFNLE